MKTEQILIKFEKEEIEQIMEAYKKEILASKSIISRSEFLRKAIKKGIKILNEEKCQQS